jgi:hypothetical protein
MKPTISAKYTLTLFDIDKVPRTELRSILRWKPLAVVGSTHRWSAHRLEDLVDLAEEIWAAGLDYGKDFCVTRGGVEVPAIGPLGYMIMKLSLGKLRRDGCRRIEVRRQSEQQMEATQEPTYKIHLFQDQLSEQQITFVKESFAELIEATDELILGPMDLKQFTLAIESLTKQGVTEGRYYLESILGDPGDEHLFSVSTLLNR